MSGLRRAHVVSVLVACAVVALVIDWTCTSSRTQASSQNTVGRRIASFLNPVNQPHASISGTITADRVPAAGVRVCTVMWSDDLPRALTRQPRCTASDAHGRYTIADLLPTRYTVLAMGRPYKPATYSPDSNSNDPRFELKAGAHRDHVDIALERGGAEITGTVSDSSGGPIAHASLRVEQDNSVVLGETDDTGHYSLWVAAARLWITAGADGYGPNTVQGKAPGMFDVTLVPGGSIAGIVVDAATGDRISGARVYAVVRETEAGGPPGDVTDDRGHFMIDRLAPQRYAVYARVEHRRGTAEGSVAVGLAQQVGSVVVKMVPTFRIEGRVIVEGSSTPCHEPSLSATQHGYEQTLDGSAGDNGLVHIDTAIAGTYRINAYCRGYVEKDAYPSVDVRDHDVTGLTWEVLPGATIRGRIVTSAGAPIAAVDVRTNRGGWATSDATGAYSLSGLAAGDYKLVLNSDAWPTPPDGWSVTVGNRAVVEKDLVVAEGSLVTGTVVDDRGRPMQGVAISISSASSPSFEMWNNYTSSASDGTFTVGTVTSGDYTMSASNGSERKTQRFAIHAPRPETVKIVMTSTSGDGSIHGTVVDAKGTPITDAFVTALPEGGGARNIERDDSAGAPVVADGSFEVSRLLPGTYTVRAFHRGAGEAFVDHVKVGDRVTITIRQTGTIEGRVRAGTTAPPELYIDATESAGLLRREHFLGTNGHYVVRDLVAGTYKIKAFVGQREIQASTTLAEGETKVVNLDIDGGVTLTGRLIEVETKMPVAGVNVTALIDPYSAYDMRSEETHTVTDSVGRFRIEHVPVGNVYVTAAGDNAAQYSPVSIIYPLSTDTDIGDVGIAKARVKRTDPHGELGITWVTFPDDTPSAQRAFQVAAIDPAGPAAITELRVGDIITTIDGVDARNNNRSAAWVLLDGAPGTVVTLGTSRGVTVAITLAKP